MVQLVAQIVQVEGAIVPPKARLQVGQLYLGIHLLPGLLSALAITTASRTLALCIIKNDIKLLKKKYFYCVLAT